VNSFQWPGPTIAVCVLLFSLPLAAQSTPRHDPKTPQAPASAADSGVVKAGPDVTPPKVIHEVNPGPPEREQKPFKGTVVVRVIIDDQGKVREATVVKSLKPYIDKLALDAIKQWRFKPATKDGKPVTVMANIEVNFSLQ